MGGVRPRHRGRTPRGGPPTAGGSCRPRRSRPARWARPATSCSRAAGSTRPSSERSSSIPARPDRRTGLVPRTVTGIRGTQVDHLTAPRPANRPTSSSAAATTCVPRLVSSRTRRPWTSDCSCKDIRPCRRSPATLARDARGPPRMRSHVDAGGGSRPSCRAARLGADSTSPTMRACPSHACALVSSSSSRSRRRGDSCAPNLVRIRAPAASGDSARSRGPRGSGRRPDGTRHTGGRHPGGASLSVGTAFHPRTAPLNRKMQWREWSGYFASSAYADFHDIEYNAIREAAAVIDVSPLYKYRVTGPDALRLADRVDHARRVEAQGRAGLLHAVVRRARQGHRRRDRPPASPRTSCAGPPPTPSSAG